MCGIHGPVRFGFSLSGGYCCLLTRGEGNAVDPVLVCATHPLQDRTTQQPACPEARPSSMLCQKLCRDADSAHFSLTLVVLRWLNAPREKLSKLRIHLKPVRFLRQKSGSCTVHRILCVDTMVCGGPSFPPTPCAQSFGFLSGDCLTTHVTQGVWHT